MDAISEQRNCVRCRQPLPANARMDICEPCVPKAGLETLRCTSPQWAGVALGAYERIVFLEEALTRMNKAYDSLLANSTRWRKELEVEVAALKAELAEAKKRGFGTLVDPFQCGGYEYTGTHTAEAPPTEIRIDVPDGQKED